MENKDVYNKKRKIILYTLLEVAAVLVISFVGGAFDFVNLSFSWSRIGTLEFWKEYFQKVVMYTSALLIGYFFKMEKEELNNQEYYSLLDRYRELLKSKKDSFVSFIDFKFNPETKKKFIKARADQKLLNLDKKAKDSWKLEFNKAVKSGIPLEDYEWSSEEVLDYARRRVELTKLADWNYINENFEFISISYPIVSPYVFTYNIRDNTPNNGEYRVQNQVGKDMGVVIGRKVLMVFLGCVILAMFILNPSADEFLGQMNELVEVILNYTLRFCMIIVNLLLGLHSGKQMFENNFILVLQNRIRILLLYLNWHKATNQEETYADKVLEALEKQKEITQQLEENIRKANELNLTS